MKATDIYERLPILFQNFACTVYGFKERRNRFGDLFDSWFSFLLGSQWYSRYEIITYQNEQLRRLMHLVHEWVPYYKNLLSQNNLSLNDFHTVEDLKNMPVLTKDIIRSDTSNFINKSYKRNDLHMHQTSGSTGSALKLFRTSESLSSQWAVWWRHRQRFGISPHQWHVNFTGRPIVPLSQTKPPYWRWDYARKQLLINMQSINENSIKQIAEIVNNKRFKFFSGAPSMIYSFFALLEKYSLSLKEKPNIIFFGAENVLDYQLQLIEGKFGIPCSDQYGFSEGCGNASKCEYGYYHEDFEFGILECENKDYNTDGTYTGNILATGFTNEAFPLIRYRVGDVGTWMPDDFECPCGRKSKVLKHIDGRIEDYILTPEGNKIMRLSYLFKETEGIFEAQVVQEELNSIVIKLVPNQKYSERDKKIIMNKVRTWISPTIKVYFKIVDSLPRTSSGKLRAVISRLNKQ